ncbi:ABC transporter substrate-binding protein [Bifidobacterium lemurum]|uniref:ABC transporter substrate-binding protein n=1 Tax=Bifidobacterium lemurum TaxID=1603886 RepID=A0A261FTY1_9BIFI|nr:sugar ABC transporter substrate-binding protein [Bifidobacterium lemurum]OZG62650.1 ABC transporter substrate-binding protein [Bifidobacterium lemurum]QOL34628.1 sugar ABC transporter substrate-binding protein [Bifidobacterium lemurum]
MNVNFKRVTAAAVAVATLASMAACGSSTASSDDDNTLTFSYWDTFPVLEEFKKANPEIELKEVNVPGDDYNTKINQMILGDQAPDVMLLQEADYVRYAKNGVIDELDASEYGVDESDFQPAVADIAEQTGGTYGFPQGMATEIMYYNKDMFDAAGLDYPTDDWTWDDYAEAAQKLTKTENGQTVQWGSDAPSFNGIWYSLAGQGGDKVVDDGKLSLGDGLKAAMEYQDKMTNELKAQPEPSSGSKITDLFAAGQAAMTLGGSWLISTTYKDVEFNWDIATMPAAPGGQDYNSLHTSFFAISSTSEHKTAAQKFIKWMMSEEGQIALEKANANISALKTIGEKGDWQVQGTNGPTNWEAFEKAAEEGKFGYTTVASTPTFDIYNDLNAYVLGQKSMEDVLTNSVDKANKDIAEAE